MSVGNNPDIGFAVRALLGLAAVIFSACYVLWN